MTRSREIFSPAMRSDSRIGARDDGRGGAGGHGRLLGGSSGEVEPEIERIEVAPAAALPADRSMRRLTSSGTFCSDVPPCERSGTSSPDRSCRSRLVPITVSQPRHDHEVADAVRRQLETRGGLRAGQHRFDSGQRGDPLGHRAR